MAPVLTFVSLNVGGYSKGSLVIILITDIALATNSNCLAIVGDEPSPTFGSCIFDALGNFLVEEFFRGIAPVVKTAF